MKKFLLSLFNLEIKNKAELLCRLQDALTYQVINRDDMAIIESVLAMNNLIVRDIMLPKAQVTMLDINSAMLDIVAKILKTGHSRFPVVEGYNSEILGVFHSKDIIYYFTELETFNLKTHLRQVYYVSEIKKLVALLFEMRLKRAHMAIVVDEFSNIVGIVTLEMVVEQLVGEIADEHDACEIDANITELSANNYRVKGVTSLKVFNNAFNLNWQDEYVRTVSGFLIKYLGKVPEIGFTVKLDKLTIDIINADSRTIKLLQLSVDTTHLLK